MSSKNQLVSVRSILNNLSLFQDLPPTLLLLHLTKNWSQIGGEVWGPVSRPTSYKDKILTLKMKSSCHLQEAHFQKEQLMNKINGYFKTKYIQKIRLIV